MYELELIQHDPNIYKVWFKTSGAPTLAGVLVKEDDRRWLARSANGKNRRFGSRRLAAESVTTDLLTGAGLQIKGKKGKRKRSRR